MKECREDEIKDELKDQQVSEVKKIMKKKDGNLVATGTIILTFSSPKLPPSIKVGYMNIKVDPFIPNPLRCFQCQLFGHTKNNCKRGLTCPKCGKPDHEETPCNAPLYCVNCAGEHAATDKNCPKWLEEKEIQNVKYNRGLSYPEARDIVRARTRPPASMTFASAAAAAGPRQNPPAMVETATQTNLTWPNTEEKPIPLPVDNKQTTDESCQTLTTLNVPVQCAKPSSPQAGKARPNKEQPRPSTSKTTLKTVPAAEKTNESKKHKNKGYRRKINLFTNNPSKTFEDSVVLKNSFESLSQDEADSELMDLTISQKATPNNTSIWSLHSSSSEEEMEAEEMKKTARKGLTSEDFRKEVKSN